MSIAQSAVPIRTRQTMLTTLYDTFQTLYLPILKLDPSLPATHSLAQESDVYSKSNKITYRNASLSLVSAMTTF